MRKDIRTLVSPKVLVVEPIAASIDARTATGEDYCRSASLWDMQKNQVRLVIHRTPHPNISSPAALLGSDLRTRIRSVRR